MADINKLKDKIKSTIYPNGKGAINASDHQAMLLDMADGMAETDTKVTELSAEIENINLENKGEATILFPSSAAGWNYYKIPTLKNGKTYSFALDLAQALEKVMYWTIRCDGANIFTNQVINVGESAGAKNDVAIVSDYNVCEIGVYSGLQIPSFTLSITTTASSGNEINAIKEDVAEIQGEVAEISENLQSLSEDVYGERHSFVNSVQTLPSYQGVELPYPIKKGNIVTKIVGNNVWLGVKITSAKLELTAQTLPYTATEDYVAVFSNGVQDVQIVANDGQEDIVGVVEKVEELNETIQGISLDIYGEKHSYINSVQTLPSYQGVELPYPIKKGNIITKVIGNNVWLGVKITSAKLELTAQTLPYTATEDYVAVFSNGVQDVQIVANDGQEDIVGVVEKVENLSNEIEVLSSARPQVYITPTDSEEVIYDKFAAAKAKGNCDIIVEKAEYNFREVYAYMKNLGIGWRLGLPIGNGCRYYFNGATFISNETDEDIAVNDPWASNAPTRFILDADATDFEIYDAILVNNRGTYCVHDEGNGVDTPYIHKYVNVIFKTDGRVCIGAGMGYDTTIELQSCQFYALASRSGNLNIHAPTNNTTSKPVKAYMSIKGCYYMRGFPLYMETKNIDSARDSIELILHNNDFQNAPSSDTTSAITSVLNIDDTYVAKYSERPINVKVGFSFYCTDKKTSEASANGIVLYHRGNGVWTDALGREVN